MSDFLGPEMRAVIRKTADKTRAHARLPLPKNNDLELVWGVVETLNAGPPLTVSLQLMGDTTGTITVNARYLGSYSPTAGDSVVCVLHGKDLIVLGALAPAGASDDKTWAIVGASVYRYPGWTATVAGTISGLWCVTSSGSAAFEIYQNGSSVIGPITANTSHAPASFTAVTVDVGDYFELNVTVVSGTPDLSVSAVLDS
jgi:hypothetical protein